jgi:hypothetical protein
MKILWLAVIPGHSTLPVESGSLEHFADAMDGKMDGEMDGEICPSCGERACTLG